MHYSHGPEPWRDERQLDDPKPRFSDLSRPGCRTLKRMRLSAALASAVACLLAAVGTGTAARHSTPELPLRAPAKLAVGPLLGFEYTQRGTTLAPIHRLTLRPRPGRSLRLPFVSAWAISSTRSQLALAVHDDPVNQPNLLEVVELPSLRIISQPIELGGDVSTVAWIGSSRVAALVGKANCCPSRVVVVDVDADQIVSQEPLPGTVLATARSSQGLVLLVSPRGAVGPAALVTIDPRGVRQVRLPRLSAGRGRGGARISRVRIPGLAVDANGAHAYVVDPGSTIADVDLPKLRATYHPLAASARYARTPYASSTPAALAKGEEGPVRTALWLGDGLLLVAGRNAYDTPRLGSEPAGLRLVNVRQWTSTVLDPEVDSFTVSDGFLVATGVHWNGNDPIGTGLKVFGTDTKERLRLFVGRAVGIDRVFAGRAYVGGNGWNRDRVVDLRGGRIIGVRAFESLAVPLLGVGSVPSNY